MESPIFAAFFEDRSKSGSTDICVNLYPEHQDGPKGPEISSLLSVPGKTLLATIGTGPIRGFCVANNGLMYVVSGNTLWSVTASYVTTSLGTIGSNNGPVSIVNSPTQILVVDGTGGWVWDYSGAVTQNVTTAVASPGVVGVTANPFAAGSRVSFTTAGALPTGLTAGVFYYVLTTGWTSISFSVALAPNGPAINFTGSTSGQSVCHASGQSFSQVIPNSSTSLTNPSVAVYQDGFAIVNQVGSNLVYQSNYNDLATYASGVGPTANNAYIQQNSKPVITIFDLKEEVWIFKDKTTEVWINQGSAGFAFTPLVGVSIPYGCAATASVCQLGNSIAWMGGSDTGYGVVYLSQGYDAKPITTLALTALFQTFPIISDAIGWGYQSDGHFFYVLTFPSQGVSYCYDLATGKWHQRAGFTNGQLTRDWANCFASFNGVNIVGDYQSANIYSLTDAALTDNGVPRKWVRAWRALPSTVNMVPEMSFDSLQILMETGITVAPGTNPQMMLRWSNDGGYTWTNYYQLSMGQLGLTTWRVIMNRLGSTSIGGGMDRIFEISGTDAIQIKITGAEVEGGAQ